MEIEIRQKAEERIRVEEVAEETVKSQDTEINSQFIVKIAYIYV